MIIIEPVDLYKKVLLTIIKQKGICGENEWVCYYCLNFNRKCKDTPFSRYELALGDFLEKYGKEELFEDLL